MTLARAHDALIGRRLGEFVLRERIGEGGFGAVYRAIQPALDREAVIKVLHARLLTSKSATERFLREAKLASKLDHPYAAHVYAFGAEPDGELWIAMELVRGTPLDQVLKLQGALTLERFIPLLDRICEVVHTAHEQGIVHRDLKPANVMVLSRAGRLLPKLLDFGIAKGLLSGRGGVGTDETLPGEGIEAPHDALAQTLDSSSGAPIRPSGLTIRGAIMGSPHYMAPEQWVDAGQVDARTDLYALGVLAYECLTGKPPFLGQTITAIAQAHASDLPAPLGSRFPAALDKVLAKVLAKDPAERYGDALALAAAMRGASGIATDVVALPVLDPIQRDVAITGAPQPIAEAIAAFEAARNAHQARDALALVGRTIVRYVGLLALACRSRVSLDDDASEAIRAMHRRPPTDREWLDLARELTRGWRGRPDAYPIPELVTAFEDGKLDQHLEKLLTLRDAESAANEPILAVLEDALLHANAVLELLGFLRDYPLVVTMPGGIAERWMGVRRAQRSTIAVSGKGLAVGAAALLDRDGAPVLTLDPLFKIAAPTPGAPLDLFLFEGRGRRGAKLVSLPSSFEYHDDSLWDWFRAQLAGSFDETDAPVSDEKPPYRGLSAFSAEDSAQFIGRERLVDAFVNRLKISPLLVVVGRSGAGKSSFVHAGVVPALQPAWRVITLRPGPSPLGSLIARLEHAGIAPALEWTTGEMRTSARLPAVTNLRDAIAADREALGTLLRADAAQRGPLLLIVDQLEEMFTLCHDEAEQRQFAECLAGAARSVEDSVRVVVTLRDDFLVRAEQVAALRNRIGPGLQILTVPAADDLLRIVTEPARRVGYELEGALASEIVGEVADQPGALALISFTASKLWELRDRHFKQLTRSAYKTLGGVGGALARHAELTLDAMLPEERALTREALRHLVTTQNTRAVLPRTELRQLLGDGAHADGVIEKLVTARLLVTSENETGAETIEIIHEALIVSWPRLVEWRRDDSEGTRFREQLRSAAKQWDERGRAKGLLWRGDALGELTRWRGRHAGPLIDIETAFTDASLADVARARRTVRLVVMAAFVVLGAVLIGLVFLNARAVRQRERAEAAGVELHDNLQRTDEDQGRRYMLADDPLRALAYLAKARELGATGPFHDLLVAEAIQRSSGELLEVRHRGPSSSAQFSSDGARLLTAGDDHVARVWDARTGAQQLELPHASSVVRATFGPDDATVFTASMDGTTALWDARTGAQLRTFGKGERCAKLGPHGKLVLVVGTDTVAVSEVSGGAARFERHVELPSAVCAISANETLVAVGTLTGTTSIVDARTGAIVRDLVTPTTGPKNRAISWLAFSPDETRILVIETGGAGVVWSVATGEQLATFAQGAEVLSAEYSPTGDRIATSSIDRTATIWDARTGAKLLGLDGHQGRVNHLVFAPDGATLVTVSNDATAWLWDAATGEVLARWRGHQDSVSDAAFDRTGDRVATVSQDGRVIVWTVRPQEQITRLVGHRGQVWNARFSQSGTRVITAGEADSTVRIWSTSGQQLLEQRHPAGVADAALSPDERLIAAARVDGTLQISDSRSGQALHTLVASSPAAPDPTVQLAWSPDGGSIATASHDGWLRCWDTTTWALKFETKGHGGTEIYSISFGADGRSILTAGADLATRRWDLHGQQLSSRPDPETITSAALEPSGARALNVELRQRVAIWNVADGSNGPTLIGHGGMITDAEWSPDGAYIVTASGDRTVRIWESTHGDALAVIAPVGGAISASYAPDGRHFVIAGPEGNVAIYAVPSYDGTAADLATLLACRVPYEVKDDRLVPRERVCKF